MSNRSYHPASASRNGGNHVFTVFVNTSSFHARAGRIGASFPNEVEVRRHRRDAESFGLCVEAARRLNAVAQARVA